nr:DUF3892 domain-containing protein [Agrobacterium tumefaciens]
MACPVRVQTVVRRSTENVCVPITHLGDAGATNWKLPVEEVIRQIEAGECEFYVLRPIGDVVDLVVAVGPGKRKYLMTLADLDQPDTLLNLQSCVYR